VFWLSQISSRIALLFQPRTSAWSLRLPNDSHSGVPARLLSQCTSNHIRGTPTPPYAMLKEIPELTAQLASKCAHQLIVASAIMNVAGKLEQVSVKRTPDSQLIAPLIEALNNWTFEPAQIDGKPVALKILLGIRLSAR